MCIYIYVHIVHICIWQSFGDYLGHTPPNGHFHKLGVFCVGALKKSPSILGTNNRAPEFWKLPNRVADSAHG